MLCLCVFERRCMAIGARETSNDINHCSSKPFLVQLTEREAGLRFLPLSQLDSIQLRFTAPSYLQSWYFCSRWKKIGPMKADSEILIVFYYMTL